MDAGIAESIDECDRRMVEGRFFVLDPLVGQTQQEEQQGFGILDLDQVGFSISLIDPSIMVQGQPPHLGMKIRIGNRVCRDQDPDWKSGLPGSNRDCRSYRTR